MRGHEHSARLGTVLDCCGGVLLSPALAFFMALIVAVVVGLLKEAGALAVLAIAVVSIVGYFGVRRLRGASGRA
jgi:hypothetical protein